MHQFDDTQNPPLTPHPLPEPTDLTRHPSIITASREAQLLTSLLSGILPLHLAHTVAAALLAAFGTPAGVLATPPERLRTIPDINNAAVMAIKTAEALAILHAQAALPDEINPSLTNYTNVIAFCRARLANKPREEVHILFMNNRNRLIRAELHQQGTIDHAPAYPREICRRALELDAKAFIIVHNHPTGDPMPSAADLRMTARIKEAAKTLDITLHDHVIVTPTGDFSFSTKGLL